MITMKDTYQGETTMEETLAYYRVRSTTQPYMYDYNYTYFYELPTLENFKEIEKIEEEQRKKDGLGHIKYKIPMKQPLTVDFKWYLEMNDYTYGIAELYQIEPKDFKGEKNPEVIIGTSTNSSVAADFLAISFSFDTRYGEEYAQKKQNVYKSRMTQRGISFLVAYLDNEPCGVVTLIETEKAVEIDSLEVLPTHRNMKVAQTLQRYAMDNFDGKKVILVADGDDTPREMYQKQGYKLIESLHEIQRVVE